MFQAARLIQKWSGNQELDNSDFGCVRHNKAHFQYVPRPNTEPHFHGDESGFRIEFSCNKCEFWTFFPNVRACPKSWTQWRTALFGRQWNPRHLNCTREQTNASECQPRYWTSDVRTSIWNFSKNGQQWRKVSTSSWKHMQNIERNVLHTRDLCPKRLIGRETQEDPFNEFWFYCQCSRNVAKRGLFLVKIESLSNSFSQFRDDESKCTRRVWVFCWHNCEGKYLKGHFLTTGFAYFSKSKYTYFGNWGFRIQRVKHESFAIIWIWFLSWFEFVMVWGKELIKQETLVYT